MINTKCLKAGTGYKECEKCSGYVIKFNEYVWPADHCPNYVMEGEKIFEDECAEIMQKTNISKESAILIIKEYLNLELDDINIMTDERYRILKQLKAYLQWKKEKEEKNKIFL